MNQSMRRVERLLAEERTNVGDVERWISIVGGGAVAMRGILRWPLKGMLLALAGGYLVYRGATGRCRVYEELGVTSKTEARRDIRVETSVLVDAPPAKLYRFWRQASNLPKVFSFLELVREIDARRSHWVAKGPVGTRLAWYSEIISEEPDRFLTWRAERGSDVPNAGMVEFVPAGDRTEVRVYLQFRPPGGLIGSVVHNLFGEIPEERVREDLARLPGLLVPDVQKPDL